MLTLDDLRTCRDQLAEAIAMLERVAPLMTAWKQTTVEVPMASKPPVQTNDLPVRTVDATAPEVPRKRAKLTDAERKAKAREYARRARARKVQAAPPAPDKASTPTTASEPAPARPGATRDGAAPHSERDGRNGAEPADQLSVAELCAVPAVKPSSEWGGRR